MTGSTPRIAPWSPVASVAASRPIRFASPCRHSRNRSNPPAKRQGTVGDDIPDENTNSLSEMLAKNSTQARCVWSGRCVRPVSLQTTRVIVCRILSLSDISVTVSVFTPTAGTDCRNFALLCRSGWACKYRNDKFVAPMGIFNATGVRKSFRQQHCSCRPGNIIALTLSTATYS